MNDDPRPLSDDAEDGPVESHEPVELDEPVETMSMRNSFGTATGAAMLGFEQALRNLPPAETLAAEHMPERGQTGDGDGTLSIEFPDPIEHQGS